jgi:hypothetical protein
MARESQADRDLCQRRASIAQGTLCVHANTVGSNACNTADALTWLLCDMMHLAEAKDEDFEMIAADAAARYARGDEREKKPRE